MPEVRKSWDIMQMDENGYDQAITLKKKDGCQSDLS